MVGEGNLISLICSLSAEGSGQCWGRGTTDVSYVCLTCPVADAGCCERQCSLLKSDAYICKCRRPRSLKPLSPLSAFVRIWFDPPSWKIIHVVLESPGKVPDFFVSKSVGTL